MQNIVAPSVAPAPAAPSMTPGAIDYSWLKGDKPTQNLMAPMAPMGMAPMGGAQYGTPSGMYNPRMDFGGSADGGTSADGTSGVGNDGSGSAAAAAATAAAADAAASGNDGSTGAWAQGGLIRSYRHGGPVRYYADGGSINAPSVQSAPSALVYQTPEENIRRHQELYGPLPAGQTQTGDTSKFDQMIAGTDNTSLIGLMLRSPNFIRDSSDKATGGLIRPPYREEARQVAAQGRGPDTMLMHVTPKELRGLASLHPSGQLPRNPQTGLPEAGFLENVLPGILGTVVGSFVGMPWLGAVIGGVGTGLATGDLGKGLLSGLMSFGLGSAFAGLAEAGAGAAGAAQPVPALLVLAVMAVEPWARTVFWALRKLTTMVKEARRLSEAQVAFTALA